jgi:multidrug resistance efflux pump
MNVPAWAHRYRGRLLLALAGVIVLGVAGRMLFSAASGPKVSDPVRVRREDLVMTVEVTGELAAVRATEIGPPAVSDLWDYKISFMAPESSVVKKGEPVVGFDTQPLEKNLEQKSAEFAEASKQIDRKEIDLDIQVRAQELALAEAEAKLHKARLKADVPADLKGRIESVEAQLDLSDAEKEVANLQAKLDSTKRAGNADLRALRSRRDRAKGRVEDLKSAIELMRVKAPQDGIVIYKTGWRDEKKKVGDSTWVGEKLMELPDLSEMKAKGEVDEADAGQIAVGQKVTLRLEAHPDVDFTGRVRSIGQTVRRQSWRVPTKIYAIEISLDRTDSTAMRPAMRFRGDVETARVHGLLVVPRETIFLRASGPVAWVKRGLGFGEIPVRLGRSNKQFVEIVSGLSEGELISTADLRPAEPSKARGPLAAGF